MERREGGKGEWGRGWQREKKGEGFEGGGRGRGRENRWKGNRQIGEDGEIREGGLKGKWRRRLTV
jgi:hypothetical protein